MAYLDIPEAPTGADLIPAPYDYDKTFRVLRNLPAPTLCGNLEGVFLDHDGRWRFNLETSIGSFPIRVRGTEQPFVFKSGYCWQMRLQPGLRDRTGAIHAFDAKRVFNQGRDEAAWLPFHSCERTHHMQRLRALLLTLTPALQVFFIVALSSYRVEKQFLKRDSAADHHVYPGGMFDQAVEAAEIVGVQCSNFTPLDRDLAVMATLLMDIGKASDSWVRLDARRRKLAVVPHPYSEKLLAPAFKALRYLDAPLADRLRAVFGFASGKGSAPVDGSILDLRHLMGWAISLTWRDCERLAVPRKPFGKPGAAHV